MRKIKYLVILMFGVILNINAQNSTDGLIGHWPFDGNAIDISGNCLNGFVNGASTTNDRFGNINMAMEFNGPNSHVTIPYDTLLNLVDSFSFSFWIKYYDDEITAIILVKGNNSTTEYSIAGNIGLNKQNVKKVVRTDSSLVLNEWHHVVITYNNTVGKIYIDSVLTKTDTLTSPPFGSSNTDLYIGEYVEEGAVSPAYLVGALDDLRIYNRILESDEINSLYTEHIYFETIYDTIKVYDSIAVTDTLIIDVDITGVNPPNNKNTLKVYPNPTKDKVYIHTEMNYQLMSNYKIKIINSSGSTVCESIIEQQNFEIDMRTFGQTGLYFIQIINDDSQIIDIRKIILK